MGNWRKSTYSDGSGGNCVETASGDGTILVRDTADRDSGTLTFTASVWQTLMTTLKK